MRWPATLLGGAALALAAAAPAAAGETVVTGTDALVWDTPQVTVAKGDSVRWTFPNTTQVHNVASDSPNWTYASPLAKPAPDGTYTFDAAGVYRFVCEVHSSMTGEVTVTDGSGAPPPPPPPPPPGEQPFPSDQGEFAFERGGLDTARPALRASARRTASRVKVSFRVSERSVVRVVLARGGRTVARRTVHAARRGSVTLRGLKAGRYVARVSATDVAGNRSAARRLAVRVR